MMKAKNVLAIDTVPCWSLLLPVVHPKNYEKTGAGGYSY